VDGKRNLGRDVQCVPQHDEWIYTRVRKLDRDWGIGHQLFEYWADFGNNVLLRCRGGGVDRDKCSIEPGKCDDHGCDPERADWTGGDGGVQCADQSKLDRQYYIGCDV
jgi:hypothetical protein